MLALQRLAIIGAAGSVVRLLIAAATILTLLSGAATRGCGFRTTLPRSAESQAWMSLLPGSADVLLDLTIPGTHNSATSQYEGLLKHQCQRAPVSEQLHAGIRALDARLHMRGGRLRVGHMPNPDLRFSIPFRHFMGPIAAFLRHFPSETIFLRMEISSGLGAKMYTWNSVAACEDLRAFSSFWGPCRVGGDCSLKANRGRVILTVNKMEPWRFAGCLDAAAAHNFTKLVANSEDRFKLAAQTALYGKWEFTLERLALFNSLYLQRRNLSGAVAAGAPQVLTEEERAAGLAAPSGCALFLTGSGGVLPYFVASGKALPLDTSSSLWTGRVARCADTEGDGPYPDFPRRDCHFSGDAAVCSVHYRGMNPMLYDWLVAGAAGTPQSHHHPNIYPRYLGLVFADYIDGHYARELYRVSLRSFGIPSPAAVEAAAAPGLAAERAGLRASSGACPAGVKDRTGTITCATVGTVLGAALVALVVLFFCLVRKWRRVLCLQ